MELKFQLSVNFVNVGFSSNRTFMELKFPIFFLAKWAGTF